MAHVAAIRDEGGLRHLTLAFPPHALDGLKRGASVAIAGTCLTAVGMEGDEAQFDCIDETLERTTLGGLGVGDAVDFERAAAYGDEIGGHVLSGHIHGVATVVERVDEQENCALTIEAPADLMDFVLEKGFIAVDGCSLTIGAVDREAHTFKVHLIPETLQVTTLGAAQQGTRLNLEVDAMTQAVVETVRRVLAEQALAR